MDASNPPKSGIIQRLGRAKRRSFSVAAVLALVLAGSLVGSSQAHAAGWVSSRHACTEIGTFNGNEAVFCADLLTQVSGSTTLVEARLEAICENISTGVDVQCADVNFKDLETYMTNAQLTQTQTHVCGHTAGNCSTNGRNFYTLTPPVTVYSSLGCQDAEGVIWAGSQIELPTGTGDTVTLEANLGSGGYALYC